MKNLARALFAPAFFFAFMGAAICVVPDHPTARALLLPGLFLLAVAVSFAAEHWLPYDAEWNKGRNDFGRDLAHTIVNEGLAIGIAILPFLAYYLAHPQFWPRSLPFWLQVAFALLVADFGITLAHWLSHRVPFLWRLHEVHHSVRRMYGFNGLMKHPAHLAVEGVFGLLPLLLIGIPFNVAAVLAYAIAIELLLQHSNFDMRLGPLRHIFAWAPNHRYHHMRYGTSGDVNFALFFAGWDRLLGTTFHAPAHRICSADLGIGTRPNYPDAYLAQLREPFSAVTEHAPVPVTPATLIL